MRYLLAALGLLLAIGLTPAHAQDKEFILKFSSWVPPGHPLLSSYFAWAKDIEKETNGTVKSTLFPSEQLGKAFDHYDMVRDGIADFADIYPDYQPGRFPVIAAAGLPFLIGNAKGGSAAVDTWYRQYASKEMKDVKFCFAFVFDPGTFHSKERILVPADIKGMKVRPADSTMATFVTLLGGTIAGLIRASTPGRDAYIAVLVGPNFQASAPEAHEMLERGVADTITFPWGDAMLSGIDKVVKYHMDTPLFSGVLVLGMNKDKYEAMSPAQRAVIDNHCTTEWAEKIASPWADFEHTGHAKLEAMPGHEVYKITPEQTELWREAAEPLKAKWAAQVKAAGYDPDAIYADLIAELKQRDSLAE